MQRNQNPRAQLVGMETGAAALANSLAVPQKMKHRITTWPSRSIPAYLPETNGSIHTETCAQMFRAVLFIRPKEWEQPKYLLADE